MGKKPDLKPRKRSCKVQDVIGMRFGRLVIISEFSQPCNRLERKDKRRMCVCRCDCGNETKTRLDALRAKKTVSCGCYNKDLHTRHLMEGTPEYNSWKCMKARCRQPGDPSFKYYGAKGITYCERWESFETFFADMGLKPSPNHTIDRYPDRHGNYQPGNCRWATATEQNQNRDRVSVCHQGHALTSDNVYLREQSNGNIWRCCKICSNAAQRRARLRRSQLEAK